MGEEQKKKQYMFRQVQDLWKDIILPKAGLLGNYLTTKATNYYLCIQAFTSGSLEPYNLELWIDKEWEGESWLVVKA